MNETEQLWCDLLNEWHDNTSGVGEPEISLENQAKYLAKKYPVEVFPKVMKRYDSASEETLETEEDRALVCFSKVIVKYRPHLHMGDYWLDIDFVNGVQQYTFHLIEDLGNDECLMQDAKHPHINHAKPCLGTYQGDLGTAFVGCNYIQFMSLMKAFLSTYTGNDTYFRGTNFKKANLHCQLHSNDQINDIFSEEAADTGIDVYTVAEDPMRWNWPKNMAAWNKIETQGQQHMMLKDYWIKSKYPVLENYYNSDLRNYTNRSPNKILGYVSIAYNIGELSLIQSFEFVRVFLLTLQAYYEGNMDDKTKKELRKLTNDIYDCRRHRGMRLNTRYNIALDSEKMLEIDELWHKVEPFYNSNNNSDVFVSQIKWAGDKLTNFVVLLRKRAPHKAASNYLYSIKDSIDVDGINVSYKRIRKHAYSLALQQLEKDKRRFINELNKPEINNTIPDVGQGTLFS